MIEPVEGQPGMYRVRLTGDEHLVSAETGQCDCLHYAYRLANKPGSLCRHGEALARYLDEQKECALCHGEGFLKPRCCYPNMEPIPCALCSRSGLREPEAPLTNAELLAIFA
jgi:hypothetical protein